MKYRFIILAGIFLFMFNGLCMAEDVLPQDSLQTDSTLVNEGVKATFIEIGSTNCVACKMMAPIVEELEHEYSGQIEVIFYDTRTSEGRMGANEYDVSLIPTQIFLDKDGWEYFRHEGFFPKAEILKVLAREGVVIKED